MVGKDTTKKEEIIGKELKMFIEALLANEVLSANEICSANDMNCMANGVK